MNKKTKKTIIKLIFLTIIFLFIFSFVLNSNPVIASYVADNNFQGIGPDPSNEEFKEVESMVSKIIGILQAVGALLSIIMIIVLGINYFTASHKPDEKAKADQRMQSIFFGTLLVLGATGIITIISQVVKTEVNL